MAGMVKYIAAVLMAFGGCTLIRLDPSCPTTQPTAADADVQTWQTEITEQVNKQRRRLDVLEAATQGPCLEVPELEKGE